MTDFPELVREKKYAENTPPFPGPLSTEHWTGNVYNQLDSDLKFEWGARFPSNPDRPMSSLKPEVRERLYAFYPCYVVDATYKRLMTWAMERGIVNYGVALGAWVEYFGKDVWRDSEHRLSWFARVSRL